MRIVLDTNVIISAIVFGGVPEKIIQNIYTQKYKIIISYKIIKEIKKILSSKKFGWDIYKIHFAIGKILVLSEIIEPKKRIKKITMDPSDNIILECAVEGKADFIVTGDKKHILSLKKFKGISIYSPQQFLKRVLYS